MKCEKHDWTGELGPCPDCKRESEMVTGPSVRPGETFEVRVHNETKHRIAVKVGLDGGILHVFLREKRPS